MHFKTIGRRSLLALGAAALAASFAGTAAAQPSMPLRVILPVSAGSGVDVIVRSAQVALTKALDGQPVVIENQPGAGGITGTQNLVKAAPDGNTISVVSNNHSVNPSVFKKLPYDSLADITPITIVGGSPFVLVVNPNKVSAKNAKELQALMKARPGEFNYGSSGNGTIIHLAGEMFVDEAGVKARHIPYKGMGPMITDIVGGQVEMGVGAVAAVQGQIKSGALRPIGVMGKERVPSLPDVPTIAEQGFPGVDVAGWFAVIGPKGLPPAQVKRLHDAFATAFNDPDVKAGFAKRDDVLILNTPEEAGKFLKSEQERYARLVKKANVTLE
ncbi:tripartite tricarboxylate transporter substrate binding protein [Variovorax sp. YR216]|uniref:tripartite tricarboxylate transporter substrate binding protein n=1 Tax=Variovorax sp. YR216 TaxID=1882828 RepID=UPI000898A9B9|nr:tripartite tricarboxylate transporter substrate binding protein [Variovorax sp. YR216]SEB08193.1 Tripartite-type tricarboxylate transporter, receptor component TctC [Variovorax sp. YR216]